MLRASRDTLSHNLQVFKHTLGTFQQSQTFHKVRKFRRNKNKSWANNPKQKTVRQNILHRSSTGWCSSRSHQYDPTVPNLRDPNLDVLSTYHPHPGCQRHRSERRWSYPQLPPRSGFRCWQGIFSMQELAILLTEGIRKNTSHIPIFIAKKTKLVWPMISHTVSSISPFWCFFVDPNHEADNHPEFSNLRETQAQEDRGATCIEQILVDHEGSIKLIPKFSASRHVLRNDKRKGMSGECS